MNLSLFDRSHSHIPSVKQNQFSTFKVPLKAECFLTCFSKLEMQIVIWTGDLQNTSLEQILVTLLAKVGFGTKFWVAEGELSK